MGKIIDAEFGGHNAGDRYCTRCDVRFPRRSALCPRCGGALVLWATHVGTEKRKKHEVNRFWNALIALALFLAILVLSLVRGRA